MEDDITVSELYERWVEERLKNASDAYIRTTKSAWSYCSSLHTMRVKDLKPRHIKGCIECASRIEEKGKKKGEKIEASSGTKMRIKSLFNIMLDYAMEYEIVNTNAARNFEISDDIITDVKENKRSHIIFTENEMKTLWSHVSDTQYVDWILIQCYTGWRPQELATLKLTDIHLDQWYMQAGMKTPAGKQRIVPIHSRIQPLVLSNYHRAMEIGSEYLFNDKGQTHAGSWAVTYDKYRNRFNKVIQKLNLNSEHRAHDPRMTFITNGKKVGMDEYALKEMVGHSIQDITESTYTIRDLEWLRNDLEKLV